MSDPDATDQRPPATTSQGRVTPSTQPASAASLPGLERQRRHILDVALAVFGRHGFRTTSMSMVATEADLSRQGLYNYYASKEVLFEACAEDLHSGARHAALAAAQAARAAGHDPAGVLTAQLVGSYSAFFVRMRGTPHASELLDEVARRCRSVVVRHAEFTIVNLAATLSAEIEAGRLALDLAQVQRLAAFLLAAVRGLKAAVPPIAPEALEPDLAAMVRLLLDGATAQSHATRQGVEPAGG